MYIYLSLNPWKQQDLICFYIIINSIILFGLFLLKSTEIFNLLFSLIREKQMWRIFKDKSCTVYTKSHQNCLK